MARILIADDNVDGANTLDRLLRDPRHEIKVCNDGRSCIDIARSFHPHVALLDIGLPRANGYEVAKAIRTMPFGRSVLIIAISGYGAPEVLRHAEEAGFDFHMVKPANIDRLVTLIAGYHAPE